MSAETYTFSTCCHLQNSNGTIFVLQPLWDRSGNLKLPEVTKVDNVMYFLLI